MQQWEEFKRAEAVALKRQLDAELEAINCKTCGSTWFEQVKAFQFKSDHHVIIGQDVPPRQPGAVGFVLLRCLRCSDLLEPRVLHNTRDVAAGSYDDLLDTLQGKDDRRKTEEKKNEVQGQGQQPVPGTR